jgi:putative inorganic carbon (HCO3(-)) transporter
MESTPLCLSARISRLAHRSLVALLLATLLILPLLFSSNLEAWRGVRPIVFELLALALVGLALAGASGPTAPRRIVAFLRTGPNLPILLLVLYAGLSVFWSSAREFSYAEWVRLACGAGLYFVLAAALQQRWQITRVVDGVIAAAIATSLFGLVAYGESGSASVTSSFGNKQLFAGFMVLLVPLLLALSFSDLELKHRIAARGAAIRQVAASLSVTALLLSQNRSSWVGVLVAVILLGVLTLRGAPLHRLTRSRHRIVAPLAILLGSVGIFMLISGTGPVVKARAITLAEASQDSSFAWRLDLWQGAAALIRERPLVGWGIGTFPLELSHAWDGARPREVVRKVTGPTLSEQAHNEYLQLAADLGLIGLGLHLWILGAFFSHGLRTLRGREHGFRRLVLMGCLAGLAAQAVDALGNPAWRFTEVSFLFWFLMGLGMAAAALLRRSAASEPTAAPVAAIAAPARLRWQAAALALTVSAMGGVWAAHTAQVAPVPCYSLGEPNHALMNIVGGGDQATINVGECITLRLRVRFKGTNTYVDVTNDPNTGFFTEPPRGQFPARNVFCPTAADANKIFTVYGRYCDPCSGICITDTVIIRVRRTNGTT